MAAQEFLHGVEVALRGVQDIRANVCLVMSGLRCRTPAAASTAAESPSQDCQAVALGSVVFVEHHVEAVVDLAPKVLDVEAACCTGHPVTGVQDEVRRRLVFERIDIRLVRVNWTSAARAGVVHD